MSCPRASRVNFSNMVVCATEVVGLCVRSYENLKVQLSFSVDINYCTGGFSLPSLTMRGKKGNKRQVTF